MWCIKFCGFHGMHLIHKTILETHINSTTKILPTKFNMHMILHLLWERPTTDWELMFLQVSVATSTRELCHKLAELGWLFHKVNRYVGSRSRDKAFGLVGQVSFYLHTITMATLFLTRRASVLLLVKRYQSIIVSLQCWKAR